MVDINFVPRPPLILLKGAHISQVVLEVDFSDLFRVVPCIFEAADGFVPLEVYTDAAIKVLLEVIPW